MIYRLGWLALASIALSTAADAAPARPAKRPAPRPPAKAAPKPAAAVAPPAPSTPTTPGIMVPKPVQLVRATPDDERAHAIWSLRAALNVAALQCQYSPFLRATDNYNQIIKKHGDELAAAQKQMIAHFTRTQKAGMAGFDRYNTRSYNSFSTLDAQYNFCWTAGQASQALRVADVGTMHKVAQTALPQVRAALALVPPAAGLAVPQLAALPVFPPIDPVTADN